MFEGSMRSMQKTHTTLAAGYRGRTVTVRDERRLRLITLILSVSTDFAAVCAGVDTLLWYKK
jgi:hypothetical protein